MRLLVIGVVVLLAGCSTVSTAEPVVVPTPAEVPVADYSALPAEFGGNGSWVAGVDIKPGSYTTEFDHESCKWFLGDDGVLAWWGDSEFVTLDAGKTIEVQGCSMWVMVE